MSFKVKIKLFNKIWQCCPFLFLPQSRGLHSNALSVYRLSKAAHSKYFPLAEGGCWKAETINWMAEMVNWVPEISNCITATINYRAETGNCKMVDVG
jgi:hypothetical protein